MQTENILQKSLGIIAEQTGTTNWALDPSVTGGRKCQIYLARSDAYPCALAIKIYRPGHASNQADFLQYAAMEKYYPLQDGESFRIARPIARLEEDRCFIMEWYDSPKLSRQMWQNILTPDKAQQYIAQSGKWLRAFHEAGHIKTESFRPHWYQQRKKLLALTADSHSGQKLQNHNRVFSHATRVIDALTPASLDADIATAPLHGDFTPSNILLGDNKAIGIDIWAHRRAPIMADLIRMNVYLTIGYPGTFQGTDIAGWPALAALKRGYGQDLFPAVDKAFLVSLLAEYVRRWVVIEQRVKKTPRYLLDYYRLSRMQKPVRQILEKLSHIGVK